MTDQYPHPHFVGKWLGQERCGECGRAYADDPAPPPPDTTHIKQVLNTLPTVLHNRLSDDTRESTAIAFATAMDRLGLRIVSDGEERWEATE